MSLNKKLTLDFFVIFVIVLIISYYVYFLLYVDPRILLYMVFDDAAYFLKVAANIASGHGQTFDGYVFTTGLQPLWLWVLSILSWVHTFSPEVTLRVVLLLQMFFLISASLLVYSVQSKILSKEEGYIGLLLFFILVVPNALNGMESALLILVLCAFFSLGFIFSREHDLSYRNSAILGCVIGLIILSRIDTIILAVTMLLLPLILAIFKIGEIKKCIVKTLIMIFCIFVVISPYFIFNYFLTGYPLPISYLLKSTFPIVSFSKEPPYDGLNLLALFYVFGSLTYLAYFISIVDKRSVMTLPQKYYLIFTTSMASYVVLHYLHTILFMKWAIFQWHFISYTIFGVLSATQFFAYIIHKLPDIRYSLILVLSLQALFTYPPYSPVGKLDNWQTRSYEASQWAKSHTLINDTFAMSDAGIFSFFSGRRVINLDGVVNDIDYQDILRNKSLNNYLISHGVHYLAQHAVHGRDEIAYGNYTKFPLSLISHRYGVWSDDLILRKSDEVYRSQLYYDGPYVSSFIIWDLSNTTDTV